MPHSLFFALFPSPDGAQRMARLARALRATHGLTGKLLLPERLRVTLLDYADGVPEDVVAAAKGAAAAVAMPRFDIVFDRVPGFTASRAVVMRCGTPSVPLAALVRALGRAAQGGA